MKFFTLFALIAGASAVHLSALSQVGATDQIEEIFHQIDSNGNGEISPKELRRALIAYAKSVGHKITKADKRWVKDAAQRADHDGNRSLDLEEFRQFANEFHAQYIASQGDSGDDGYSSGEQSQDDDDDQLQNIFNMVDTSGDGFIQPHELESALRAYAKQEGHKITADDEKWVGEAVQRADQNKDHQLDFPEFVQFAHEFGARYEGKDGDDGDDDLQKIFDMVDTSHDGLISADELETALRAYAKSKNYQVTPEDEKWVEETAGRADTNDDDHLDYNEFVQFAHEFQARYESGGDDQDELRGIFKHVDTSGDGLISADELETALRAFAKSKNYTITPADEKWVEEAAGRADKDDNDHLDFDEFVKFVYEFKAHYGIQ